MSTPESTAAVGVDRERGKNITALRGLWPFAMRYKWTMAAAFFMLTFTALISLILPKFNIGQSHNSLCFYVNLLKQ